jgi:Family of unknown function (DUF6232)
VTNLIYKNSTMEITPQLIKTSSNSYPINGVTSVFLEEPYDVRRKNVKEFPAYSLIFTVLLLIFGAVGIVSNLSSPVADGMIAPSLSLVCGILLAFKFWGAYRRWDSIPEYSHKAHEGKVIIRTASGEVSVVSSYEIEVLQEIKDAIEKAIVARG